MLIVVLAATPSLASAESLELICRGTARFQETGSVSSSTEVGYGNYASSNATVTTRGSAAAVMGVRIDDAGGGAAKLPSQLVPLLAGKSEDGWRPFTSLELSEDRIKATMSLNILNKPKLTIDRRTGDIEVSALQSGFTGACEDPP